MRSAMAVTAATDLSTISVAMPAVADQPDGAPDLVAHDGRQAFGRLVEDEQARVGQQRAADGQHLLLAARELVAAVGPAAAQGAGTARARARAVQRRWPSAPARSAIARVLRHAQAGEDAPALRHVGDAAPGDGEGRLRASRPGRRPARGRCAARTRPTRVRISVVLPMPLRPIRPMVSPALDGDRNAAQDVALAVVGVEACGLPAGGDGDGRHHACPPR